MQPMSDRSSAPPRLFDRELLRARAARRRDDFVLPQLAADMAERLGAVLRDFALAIDLASPGPDIARALAALPRIGRVLRAGPLPGGRDLGCDLDALPFGPATLDLVVSASALHWAEDLPGTLVQVRRALRPDGLFLAAMPGGDTLTELRQAFAAAEAEIEGGASPHVIPFADVRDLGTLLQRAGFALPVVDSDRLTVRYRDLAALFRDLRSLGAANPLLSRRRTPLRRATLERLGEIYRERFADADGRLRVTVETVWLSGWAPHESQQQPLKPGSARARLADALRTVEVSPRDV